MVKTDRTTQVWKDQHDFAAEELSKYDFLYKDWIYPHQYEDFRDEDVLEAGSGPGIQVRLLAEHAKHVVAVDREAIATTQTQTGDLKGKVEYIQADIGTMDLGKQFDVVNCVGVIHHTDDPDKTFDNLVRHTKAGGKIVIWAYAYEGNFFARILVEPFRKLFLQNASHRVLWFMSYITNLLLYIPIHTIYRLPFKGFPYYEYFGNARRMSFKRNALNIYDKLNAPQTHFITEGKIRSWFNTGKFEDIHISMYKGTSWRGSGTKK